MCECDPTSPASIPWWLAAARGAHLGSCLLLFGFLAFDRLVAGPVASRAGPGPRDVRPPGRRLLPLALFAALLSGAAWLVLVAADMNECSPGRAMRLDVLRVVWDGTHFGNLWQVRGVLWAVTAALLVPALLLSRPAGLRSALTWLALAASGGLLGSLAWAGHGLTGRGPLAPWHLPADVLHLLVGGVWPAGLLPFALYLPRLRRAAPGGGRAAVAHLTGRFSAMSLASVALLAATGLVNSVLLVGSFAALRTTPYGKCLLLKIVLLAPMLALGAVNLLFLKPRLSAAGADAGAARLRFNVTVEFVLGTLVVVAVAVLGVLPPTAE